MGLWLDLKQIMEQEVRAYENLLLAIKGMQEELLARNLSGLQDQMDLQSLYKQQIQELEQKRAVVCNSLELRYNMPSGSTLSKLLPYAPSSVKKVLLGLKKRLSALLQKVKVESRVMRYVLHTLIHYLDDMIEIYTLSNGVCYTSKGRKQKFSSNMYVAEA